MCLPRYVCSCEKKEKRPVKRGLARSCSGSLSLSSPAAAAAPQGAMVPPGTSRVLHTARGVIQQDGMRGFYRGIVPELCKARRPSAFFHAGRRQAALGIATPWAVVRPDRGFRCASPPLVYLIKAGRSRGGHRVRHVRVPQTLDAHRPAMKGRGREVFEERDVCMLVETKKRKASVPPRGGQQQAMLIGWRAQCRRRMWTRARALM